jgi:RNA recognition motif-containing protein
MSSGRLSSTARFFVGGLNASVTEIDLREAFLEVGVELESIELIMNRATGCSRGFALGVLRRRGIEAPIVSEDELFQQMRRAVVCGGAVTVLPVPASSSRRPRP